MSLRSLEKRLQKLKRRVEPHNGNFTLMELCRTLWTQDKEEFKEDAHEFGLGVAVHYLEAEDAMREQEQLHRETQARRKTGGTQA